MDDRKIIDRFTKEAGYDFLSNFYRSTVRFEGQLYPTVEHQKPELLKPAYRHWVDESVAAAPA